MTITIYDHELPDYTHNLYDVTFFQTTIYTLVTNTPSFVDTWISDTQQQQQNHPRIIGLDVEWRPNQARNSDNPVAVLQLCVNNRCLIFQILHSPDVPTSLKNFLKNPNYTFVGVGIENDVEKLIEDYNLGVEKMVDVRTVAADFYGMKELKNAGIKDLAMRVLGKEVNKPKGVTMSRWDNEWLVPSQVQYACIDAFLSFEIGRVLMSENQN
uniref:Werner Syndrome-like exonuclease n=1 Tax=Erigeron canadensis TaxID=72917 RepID=UPI001CB90E13|nr:Werner Syndrome-like exonuclease [Erigeron canadensis]